MERPNTTRAALIAAAVILTLCGACKTDSSQKGQQVAIDDIESAPKLSAGDEKYKDVYKLLDGTWLGKFDIYVHEGGQVEGPRPDDLKPGAWAKPPYKLQQSIDVKQVYTSDSPYFQRVEITDTYADGRVATSRGANKVQDGRMYCVVKKPDDLVIHDGSTEGADTIIWTRERKDPQAIEYFRETVKTDTYTIVGWGYYPGDDPKKTPKYYFEATYKRSK